MKNAVSIKSSRREFILKSFSSCAFCCLSAPIAFASDKKLHSTTSDQKHKFQGDSGMTMQQVYNFAYKQWYIPAMKNLMKQVGKDKFLEMLKKSSEMLYETDKSVEINYNERTLKAWSTSIKEGCENLSDRLTFEILTDNENEFEIKFTECLWAKTFREADATDIGYSGVCYQDVPNTKRYHPNLKLIREKTLMQGGDFCHFRWLMEE